jgi:phospholipase C
VSPSVTVCTPLENGIVATPAHITASTTDSNTVTALQIYVDYVLVYQVRTSTLDTYITLSLGNHLIAVQAWDSTGATFQTDVNVAMTPPCALSTKNKTVTVCTPGSGAVDSLPVHLVAGFTDSSPVTSIQVTEGSNVLFTGTSAPLDIYLSSLSSGKQTLTITATDQNGATFSKNWVVNIKSSSGLSNIKHIIYLVQENRSFDDYFGMLGPYRVSEGYTNNVDGVPTNATLYTSNGQAVHPFHYKTECTENLSGFWNEAHLDVNGGKMDQFLVQALPSTIDPYGTRAAGYYDNTDLPYYYEAATQFGTSDRFFSSVESNTNPNRMYLFAATSFGHIRPDSPPAGGWTQPTIFDNMDNAGVSWRYYYQDSSSYLPQWATYRRDSSKLYPISQYYTDIANESTLPSVLFIERASATGPANILTTTCKKGRQTWRALSML